MIAKETAQWPYLAILSLCRSLSTQLKHGASTSSFAKKLEAAVAEYGSSFSKAAYQQRLRSMTRYSQELLNEYLYHLISEREDANACRAVDIDVKIRQRIATLSAENGTKTDEQIVEEIDKMLRNILKNEGRIPKVR
jgi:hypothetical protein